MIIGKIVLAVFGLAWAAMGAVAFYAILTVPVAFLMMLLLGALGSSASFAVCWVVTILLAIAATLFS